MIESKPWRDTVVAELHAVRESLAAQFHNDLQAYTKAAEARCLALGLTTSTDESGTQFIPKLPASVEANAVKR